MIQKSVSTILSEYDTKRAFIIGQEENNTFIHLSFDKLLYENTISDDRNILNLEMVGKGSLTQKSSKCGRNINFKQGYFKGKYVSNITDQFIPNKELSISFWFSMEDFTDEVIIFKCEHKTNEDFVEIKYNNSVITWSISFKTHHHFLTSANIEVEELKTRKWIHITTTYNSNFGLANIYKNGRLMQSVYIDGSIIDPKMWIDGEYYIWKGSNFNHAIGRLDELYVINSALGSVEIHDIMGVCNLGIDLDVPNKLKDPVESFLEIPEPVKNNINKNVIFNPSSCLRRNLIEFNDSNSKFYYSVATYNSSILKCYDSCCVSEECVGYMYQKGECFRFFNTTDNFGNTISCDIGKENKLRGYLDGPWNSIFISKTNNFDLCHEAVCSKQKYQLTEYHENSNNCFGTYCGNENECTIVNDPTKGIHLLFSNNQVKKDKFKIISNANNIVDLNRLENSCLTDYSIETAKPSHSLLNNFLVRTLRDKTIEECIKTCCEIDSCDVIYRVDNTCWLITCPGKECETYQADDLAKNNKIINLKRKRLKILKSKDIPDLKKVAHLKCRPKIFKHGEVDPLESYFNLLEVKTDLNYRTCNQVCCKVKECNVAFYKQNNCYILHYMKSINRVKDIIKKTHEEAYTSVFKEKPSLKDQTTTTEIVPRENYANFDDSIYHITRTATILTQQTTTRFPVFSTIRPVREPSYIDSWTLNCFIQQNQCSQICVPVLNSYICACREGFSLQDDGISCYKSNSEADLYSDRNIGIRSKVSRNLEKPIIINKIESLPASLGKRVVLTCNALGYPEPEIIWSFSQNQNQANLLKFSNIEDIHNGTIIINNFLQQNAGDYECTAKNIVGFDKMIITLTVKDEFCFQKESICEPICKEPSVCTCPGGYELDEKRKICYDIDECKLDLCTQICINEPGSYKCQCLKNFSLEPDMRTCRYDIQCLNDSKICKPLCQLNGDPTKCVCLNGFKFIPDNFTCIHESLYDSSVFSFLSPINFSLGILGFSIMIILVTIVTIIFILYSKSNDQS